MEEQQAKISELQDRLLAMGYHQEQLNSIIKEMIGTKQVENITPQQQTNLITGLEGYIRFAGQCKSTKWSGR